MSKPRKRKGSPYYWYDFTVGGNRFRGSCETDCLATAKAIIAKLRAEAVEGQHFKKKQEKIAFDSACGRFLLEHAQYLKSYKTVEGHCRHLAAFFGKDFCLSEIGNKDVNAYVVSRRSSSEKSRAAVTDTTVNRELETLRKLLSFARDKWEVEVAAINFRSHMLREPEARTRWLTPEEAERLISCAADHLKSPIRFALLTGVRLSNVTGLKWRDVRKRSIAFRIKSNIPGGKLLELPITEPMAKLLDGLRTHPIYRNGEIAKDSAGNYLVYTAKPDDSVFTFKGQSISSSFRKAFNTACKRADIKDFRWHDLRHTAATWMVQSGVPIDLVQEVLGHTQITTTKKYAHRNHDEKLEAPERLGSAAQSWQDN
ncbi:MAG: site-specific integrase [Rickettsiales bacterium]